MVNLQERPAAVTKITNMQEKFVYDICSMYDAEYHFLEAQQMMSQCVANQELKSLLQKHIQETEQQIRNLEQVFSNMGQQPKRMHCEVAAGLVSDGQRLILLTSDHPRMLDLAVAETQAKVENFEVICYRCLIAGAEGMKQNEVVKLLQQNLQQEQQTVEKIEQCLPKMRQEAMSNTAKAR
jgi:ferritin-like metal-binding protein YciE